MSFTSAISIAVLIRLAIAIVVEVIMGIVTKTINENKGYEGGFAWGFFLNLIGIIIVVFRKENQQKNETGDIAEALLKYKRLLDSGAITEREYLLQKYKLLGDDYDYEKSTSQDYMTSYVTKEAKKKVTTDADYAKELSVYETLYQNGRLSAAELEEKKAEIEKRRR